MYSKLLTFFLIFFSSFLYFYSLSAIPAGFYADEVTIAYNAYSLLKTGRDEYGELLPIALRLFGSYTPPLYAYVTTIPITFWGVAIFSTRFMSAISGVISVLLLYLFLKYRPSINSKKAQRQLVGLQSWFQDKDNLMSFYGALFFATSPWVVLYARLGYEVYFAFTLFFLGIYFLYKGLFNNYYAVLATIPLSFSMYASHATKFLAPLLLTTYLFIFNKQIFIKSIVNNKRARFLLLVSVILQIPNIILLASGAFFVKNDLFYLDAITNRASEIKLPHLIALPYAFLHEFFARYITYFSPYSLFSMSDHDPQRVIPAISVFYIWMLVPYSVGMFSIVKNIQQLKNKFIIVLLLITPIPASFTNDPFTTQRALPFFLPVFLIIWYGIEILFTKLHKQVRLILLASFFTISCLFLYRSYFILFPVEQATAWGYGYKELFLILKGYEDQHIVIDSSRTKPLLPYYLFVNNYDPKKSHSLQKLETYYMPQPYIEKNIENIEFRPIVWESDIYKEQILVGDSLTFSKSEIAEHKLEQVFEIIAPDTTTVFVGYKTNPKEKCRNNKSAICKTIED